MPEEIAKQPTMEEQGYEIAGHIGVDAGLCWIGDPCYILHEKLPSTLSEDWQGFCDLIRDQDTKSFNYEAGHEGLGVVTSTGLGDGVYPVYIKRVNDPAFGNRIAEVRVVFIGDEEED